MVSKKIELEVPAKENKIKPIDLVRPSIKNLTPYETKPAPYGVRLDANENPFPWPEGLREQVLDITLPLNRYPDGPASTLRHGLSRSTGMPIEGILIGNGSDELIQLIMTTFGGGHTQAVIHPPTFSMYEQAAKVTGTEILEVPLLIEGDQVRLDVEGIIDAAAKPETHIVVICNPNNPTGNAFPREDILRIVEKTEKIVLVDEAYGEFSGETLMDVLPYFPNLILMKTFSKAFAMAALRIGYLFGTPETIELLNRVRQPFNVNTFSQQAGFFALKHRKEFNKQVDTLVNETQKIYEALKKLPGVKVFPTNANFVLFQPENPDVVYEELIQKGFIARFMKDLPQIGTALRVSAGLPEQNERLLQALQEIIRVKH